MTPRFRRTLLACALALGACRAAAPSSPGEIDAVLTRDARTIVRDAHFTLTSPFGETATADFADVVREEGGRVRSVLGDPGNGPIRVHLVAIEPQAGNSPNSELSDLFPSRQGIAGGASGGDLAFVYVSARDPGPRAFVQAGLLRDPIRHELVHCIARRAGLARAPWFDEGLAREIESMPADASGLSEHPFPAALVSARAAARPGTVTELLSWKSVTDLSPAERATRYDEAQALLRFLVALSVPAHELSLTSEGGGSPGPGGPAGRPRLLK